AINQSALRPFRALGRSITVGLVRLPDGGYRIGRSDEVCGGWQREDARATPVLGDGRERGEIEGARVGGVEGPRHGPFELRDVRKVGERTRGRVAFEKRAERVAVAMKVAARRWMGAGKAVG